MPDPVDLLVTGAVIVAEGRQEQGALAVTGGRVVAVGPAAADLPAHRVLDASGLHLLPGPIDSHVHLREPGAEEREDFGTGTQAAAAGGVTTVLDMPNSVPPVSTVEIFEAKARLAESKAVADFGLWGAAGVGNLPQIAELAAAGAVAFKTFLTRPDPGREAEFAALSVGDDAQLLDVFEAVAATGLPAGVHAENGAVLERETARLRAAGRTDPLAHGESRPLFAELEAVQRAVLFAQASGAHLHVLHVTGGSSMAIIRRAKAEGAHVTAETCPHYLFLNEQALQRIGPYAKINPPIRSEEERLKLWEFVEDGTLDTIGTDHAPHEVAAKERGWADIFEAPSGAQGLETLLPLLLTAVNHGLLGLPTVVRLVSESPARIFGLYPRKGCLRPGSDADFVLVDLVRTGTLDPTRMYTKQKQGARLFEGVTVRGLPVMAFSRGEMVMRNGVVLAQPGRGRLVRAQRRPFS